MGGKQKQAQRTKGNVKPSSSGRSAALLSNASLPGFSGLKDSLFSSFQTATVTDDLDPTVDPNFQMVLKKMNKKDPTTRVKALQEFIKLVENCDVEVLKAILPFWPRLYCTLAGDVEHRVREVANDAQRSVVVHAKRNMAPYLRLLAGPWFAAQFDTYPPAATAAIRAFQDAFPPNKLIEAIAFCQEEILKYISDNLLDQTFIKSDKVERTEKQERVIITCLQGYSHYLRIAHGDLLTKSSFLEISKDLLQSDQFWKLGVDKVPLIRSAWLTVLTAILEKIPDLLSEHHRRVVKRVLGRLDENDPIVLPYVWQATLNILVTLNDWSSYCDINKQVFPRLWCILHEGGYGCAATIFPNMLPLLSSLIETKENMSDKEIVVDLFFRSLREGFDKKTVQQSKSESEAVAQCYLECVRYVGKCGILDTKLVLEHVMPVIELMLTESKFNLLSRGIFEHVSLLLHYWSNDKLNSQYETMCKCFWEALFDLFTKALLQTTTDSLKKYVLNQEVQLCSSMKDPVKFQNKSVRRVKFSQPDDDEDNDNEDDDNESAQNIKDKDPDCDKLCICETHIKNLNKFVMSVSLLYLQRLSPHNDLSCVTSLAKLLSEFNDHEIFEHLVSNCNVPELFRTMLKECFSSSDQYVETIVELACSVIQYLPSTEKEEVLDLMCQKPDVLVWIFRAAQKEKVEQYILDWLQAPSLNQQLIELAQQLCTVHASTSIKAILMECTATSSNGACLVEIRTISSILSELWKASNSIEIATFAAEFLSSLKIFSSEKNSLQLDPHKEQLSENIHKLIVILFYLCCNEENLSYNTTEILSNGWQNGVNIISVVAATKIKLLLTELSGVVRNKLLSRVTFSIPHVEKLVETSVKLLHAITPNGLEMCSLFLNGILSEYELLELRMKFFCDNVVTFFGATTHSVIVEQTSVTSEEILHYILLSVFTSMVVVETMPPDPVNTSKDQHSDSKKNSDFPLDLSDLCESLPDLQEEEELLCVDTPPCTSFEEKSAKHKVFDSLLKRIAQLSLAISVCEIFTMHFQDMEFYCRSNLFVDELHKKFMQIKSSLSKVDKVTCISQMALEKANQHGGMWVHAAYCATEEDQWPSLHRSFLTSRYADYSTQIFFKKAHDICLKIPFQSLGESPHFSELTYWVKYMKDSPDIAVSSVISSPILEWLGMDHKELLYDCDISRKKSSEVEEIIKKIYFLSVCVNKCPFTMEQNIWDFIIISAAYYAQNLKHIQKLYFHSERTENILHAHSLVSERLYNVCTFSIAVFDLLNNITQLCLCVKRNELQEEHNFDDHANEWKNVFAEEVHLILTNIFISASECVDHWSPSLLGHLFLQKFCTVMIHVNEDFFIHNDASQKSEKRILTACCKLIHSSVSSLQIASYYMLKKILIHLVENDAACLINSQSLEESISDQMKFEIYSLLETLRNAQAVVDAMLAEFSFGDSCIVQPHTDTYYYTAAYLLMWNLILESCRLAGSELRYQYATLLRSENYLSSLLNNLFFLMPAEVLEANLPKTKTTVLINMFSEPPKLCVGKECTSHQLQHWACWVYYSAVSRLPALVRQWWSDTRSKVSSVVQKATVQYVTPVLCARDLQAIQNQNTKWKNMEVKVHSKARQVIAVYAVDEAQMELVITLPEEYPLTAIQVDSHTSSLVGTSQWRNWVKQLSIFLTHQNGSLWDGLLLWKSNLDKRFEGVEECYICFSILHGTNFQIPKLCCKTCKKKFHSPCLYKWFSTSNKSTCPICRNMF